MKRSAGQVNLFGAWDCIGSQWGPNGRSSKINYELITSTDDKAWQPSISKDLRNHLVHLLRKAILPTQENIAMLDERVLNFEAYTRKVEGDIFEAASSRSEYHFMVGEKIYKLEKELEVKRQRRADCNIKMPGPPPISAITRKRNFIEYASYSHKPEGSKRTRLDNPNIER
jgi:hypothetical protein